VAGPTNKPQHTQPATRDRRRDVEELASRIFTAQVTTQTGKTMESLAGHALAAAREFYRVCDQSES
jgi:hypothetical protein